MGRALRIEDSLASLVFAATRETRKDGHLEGNARDSGKTTFDDWLVRQLRRFNHVLHLLLAVALVLASAMVIWQFATEVVDAVGTGHLARGFLHAMGTLFIVWILSALISAEISFVQTGVFNALVFVEVAMITLLRQLIIEPVQMATATPDSQQQFNPLHYALLLAALLIVGVLHRLVRPAENERQQKRGAAVGN